MGKLKSQGKARQPRSQTTNTPASVHGIHDAVIKTLGNSNQPKMNAPNWNERAPTSAPQ
ncbi:MAG: hypothetical protein KatS3mg015_1425 [Fimbriimonadales bacterium]|nr:MAG: hypothetical protein KatS3mg015_1425 [Fimbriimonadales bacterium]